jgi:hypothetical protein
VDGRKRAVSVWGDPLSCLRKLPALASALTATSLLLLGCGAQATQSGSAETTTSESASLTNATPAQNDLFASIVGGMNDLSPGGAAWTPLPTGPTDVPGANASDVPGTGDHWLVYQAAVNREPDAVEKFWAAAVVSGAFRRESTEQGLPLIRGFSVEESFADGTPARNETAVIDDGFVETPVVASLDEASLAKSAGAAAQESGGLFAVDTVEVLWPAGPAPVLSLVTGEPEKFVANKDKLLATVFPDTSGYEGWLIKVTDEKDGLIFVVGSAPKVGTTVSWVRPDLAAAVGRLETD